MKTMTRNQKYIASQPLLCFPRYSGDFGLADCVGRMVDTFQTIAAAKDWCAKNGRAIVLGSGINLTMKIRLNGIGVQIDTDVHGKAHGGDVRSKLPPQSKQYSLWRAASNPNGMDVAITDTQEVFEGDNLYSLPPCHAA